MCGLYPLVQAITTRGPGIIVLAPGSMKMEANTSVNGNTESLMDKESQSGAMEENTSANSRMTKGTDRAP